MRKLLLLFIVGICSVGYAQDIHFSQFYQSPLTLNPALTASMDGSARANINYRNQWWTVPQNFGSPVFMTYSGSVDMVIPPKTCEPSRFGAGLVFYGDRAGNGQLTTNNLMASIAYHRSMNRQGNHLLSIGFQAGAVNKYLFVNDLVFEQQLDGLGFNKNLWNGENFNQQTSIWYFDMNAGALWRSAPGDRVKYSIGFTAFHLGRPKETFFGNGENRLDRRFLAHANCEIKFGEYFYLTPSFVFMYQSAATEIYGGLGAKYDVNSNGTYILAGAYYRHGDAVTPLVGIQVKKISGMVSYDVNFSDLRSATRAQGALEISLGYVLGEPCTRGFDGFCPTF